MQAVERGYVVPRANKKVGPFLGCLRADHLSASIRGGRKSTNDAGLSPSCLQCAYTFRSLRYQASEAQHWIHTQESVSPDAKAPGANYQPFLPIEYPPSNPNPNPNSCVSLLDILVLNFSHDRSQKPHFLLPVPPPTGPFSLLC